MFKFRCCCELKPVSTNLRWVIKTKRMSRVALIHEDIGEERAFQETDENGRLCAF